MSTPANPATSPAASTGVAPADAKLALTQGSVDAWATWEPYTALAETSGHARVLASGRGLLPGLSYLAATDAAIAAKRPVLQDFLLRVVRAQDWSNRNVDTYSATLARIIGISPEAAKLQFERRQQKWVPIDARVIADQQGTADFYRQVGLIKQPLEVKATFDTAFSVAG
jgi:sulfonate transport system substrate-binding protein